MTAIKDDNWNEKYNLLKEYIKEEFRLPCCNTTYNNFKLGLWVYNQSRANKAGDLPPDKLQLLNEVNPYLFGNRKEKELANIELFLASNWKAKVKPGDTPIDEYYTEFDDHYKAVSMKLFSCEDFLRQELKKSIYRRFSKFDLYKMITVMDKRMDMFSLKMFESIYKVKFNKMDPEEIKVFCNSLGFNNKKDMRDYALKLIEDLPCSEKKVITLRYGLKDNKFQTLKIIGKNENLSRERIRVIENSGFDKIRKKIGLK